MKDYYSNKLNANKLQRCYEIAPARVKQFLAAEIIFVQSRISENDTLLDLGCGYGRVSIRLADRATKVVGIDISEDNIKLANDCYNPKKSIDYFVMNAQNLKFDEDMFDVTICIQNGISAFKIDPKKLFAEALRVTKKNGIVLFSSYAESFWNERLKWFQLQANEGLIGEIDYDLTGNGQIVCKDGFRATTFTKDNFMDLASNFSAEVNVLEVDESLVFCELRKN